MAMDGHEYASVELLLCCVMLTAAVLISYAIQRVGLRQIPVSGVAMVLGMGWGAMLHVLSHAQQRQVSRGVSFAPEAFFYGLLPPIIYAAGFSLKQRDFFRNFGSILLFAVCGTLLSTVVFGGATYLLYVSGAIAPRVFTSPLLESLIYGALLSAVDPVATLSIFAELRAAPLLYNLVFGESVLNDAVAIVLFRVLCDLHEQDTPFTLTTIPTVLAQFVCISLGSIAIGVLVSVATAVMLKALEMHKTPSSASDQFDKVVYSLSTLCLSAYSSYLLAEVLGMSGIVSLFFAGVCHSHYCFYNVSARAHLTTLGAFETIAFLSETFVFTYLGLQVVVMPHDVDWGLLLSALPLCLLSRAANIFPLAALANRLRTIPIPFNMQVMQWLCGLRGAIAYALVINLPQQKGGTQALETATLMVVVVTTLVGGATTGPMLAVLGLTQPPPPAAGSLEEYESLHPPSTTTDSAPHTSDEVEYEGFHKVWKGVDRHLSRLLRTQQHADDLADTPHGLHTAASGGCWQPPEGLMPAAGGWGAGAAGGAWTETVPGAFAAALAAFASSARDTVGHAVLRVEERWRGMQQLGSEGGAQVGDGNGPRIHMEQFPMQYEAPVLDDPYAR